MKSQRIYRIRSFVIGTKISEYFRTFSFNEIQVIIDFKINDFLDLRKKMFDEDC